MKILCKSVLICGFICFFFSSGPVSADETGPKHVLVAYDLSRSMRRYLDEETMERINGYLTSLLFEGIKEVSPQDRVVWSKETPLFGENTPLLDAGDKLSFIGFGGPPIPDPEFTLIYDGSGFLKEELTKRLPKNKDELKEAWTCLELLYWKASRVFREHPECLTNLRILISDKSESRYPLNLEDQHRILQYRDLYTEDVFLDIQVGSVHLEAAEVIPPISGVKIIDPRPWEAYLASKPLPLRAQVIKEGGVVKEEG